MTKIKIVASLLIFAIVCVGAIGIMGVVKNADTSSSNGSGGKDTIDVNDFFTDTSVSTEADTTAPTVEETNTSAVAPTLQLGDQNLYAIYVINRDTNEVMIGFAAEGLKENTNYRMDWAINPLFGIDTGAYFSWYNASDGTVKQCFYLNTSYVSNEGLGDILTGSSSAMCNGNDGIGWKFTTEAADDLCVVFFFRAEYESNEQANSLTKTLESYVTELSFTEIIE